MDDDFNTPEAIAVLFELAREVNRAKKEQSNDLGNLAITLKTLANVLGLLEQSPAEFLQSSSRGDAIDTARIEALIAERTQARKDRNFARSDEIRDMLLAEGIVLEDTREGTTWRKE
jgi:cysteinyl-tRNA synthetase